MVYFVQTELAFLALQRTDGKVECDFHNLLPICLW
jgi:hypothetical protein